MKSRLATTFSESFFLLLPDEILLLILFQLKVDALIKTSVVNKRLYTITSDAVFWRRLGQPDKKSTRNLSSLCSAILKKDSIDIALVGDSCAKSKIQDLIGAVFSCYSLSNPYSLDVKINHYDIKLWQSVAVPTKKHSLWESYQNRELVDRVFLDNKKNKMDFFIIACDNSESTDKWINNINQSYPKKLPLIVCLNIPKSEKVACPCLFINLTAQDKDNSDFFKRLIEMMESYVVNPLTPFAGEKKSSCCLTM